MPDTVHHRKLNIVKPVLNLVWLTKSCNINCYRNILFLSIERSDAFYFHLFKPVWHALNLFTFHQLYGTFLAHKLHRNDVVSCFIFNSTWCTTWLFWRLFFRSNKGQKQKKHHRSKPRCWHNLRAMKVFPLAGNPTIAQTKLSEPGGQYMSRI